MQDSYIECPELAGKTIQEFRIHRDTGDGTSGGMRSASRLNRRDLEI